MRAGRIGSVVIPLRSRNIGHWIEACVVQADLIQEILGNHICLARDGQPRDRIKSKAVTNSHGAGCIPAACDSVHGSSRKWIVNLVCEYRPAQSVHPGLRTEDIAEITPSLSHAGDGLEKGLCGVNPGAFIVAEEEYLLLNDRSANRPAELILLVGRFLICG